MGLFSKSKESKDLKQTQEIKDVSTQAPLGSNLSNLENTGLPELNLDGQMPNPNQTQQSNFNNPFATNNNSQPESQVQSQPQPELNLNNQMPNMDISNTPQPTTQINQQTPIEPQVQQNNQPQNIQQNPIPSNPPIGELINSTNQQTPNEPQIQQEPQTQPQPELNLTGQLPNMEMPNNNPQPTQQAEQPQTNSIFNTDKSKLPSDANTKSTTQNPAQPNSLQIEEKKQEYTKDQIQELVDETVEQVIEERWQQLVQKIEKVAQWKDKQEQHINLIKDDILTMKESFDKLEKRIVDKVSSYDRNILDVNSEIKALEKVFQKITPTLVNNVNELSNIAKTFKPESKTDSIE